MNDRNTDEPPNLNERAIDELAPTSRVAYPGAEHVFGLAERLRLGGALKHVHPRVVWSLYVFINGFVTIGLLALLALITRTPFVFPSLGPTAYLAFFSPLVASSSPRNAVLGHAIGLACGYGAFRFASLAYGPPNFHNGISISTVLAAALSLALTGAFMVLLRVNHPPAGATTLIVSLGILSTPRYLLVIEVAVVLLAAQAFLINRLSGLPFPVWKEASSV